MESIDRPPFPRRHLAFLLFVFLVPFAVLTALAIRTLNQERELAVRREEDGRRQLAAAVHMAAAVVSTLRSKGPPQIQASASAAQRCDGRSG
jgi:hypothetical protein